jgi:competence ComEA-like helix-hairpin-helix protein
VIVLTPAERRAALLLAGLLALGAATDHWGGRTPAPAAGLAAAPAIPARLGRAPDSEAIAVPGERVDLNRASLRELDALPGVGPVLASRILEHRARHGAFRSVEDLRAIRGIGPKLYARLALRVRVAPAPRPATTLRATP